MSPSLDILISILPFAFAIHNLEEVISMEKWTKSIPSRIHPMVTTGQFSIAVGLFTLLGFLVIFSRNYYPSREIYLLCVSGFAGMLFLNTFFPHLIATIYLKKYAPGVITGVLINFPITSLILLSVYKLQIFSSLQLILSILIGGISGIFLAFLFLKIGYAITSIKWK